MPARPARLTRLWPLLLGALLALAAAALTATPALAAPKTWAGGDGNWMTGANWSGGVAPVAGDDLIFPLGDGHLTKMIFRPARVSTRS